MTGRILVTGLSGQLASALAALGEDDIRLAGRPELDFDAPAAIPAMLASLAPRLIVNAAAYTAVDKAETEREAAARANHQGPAILARHCADAGIPLIHVSTDYVFDGAKGAPYIESDPTNPTGVYGATKLAGELAVLESGARAVILRTSWVHSATGKNFVRTMLAAAKRVPTLRVVADQRGCPTSASDLAQAILTITRRIADDGWQPAYQGVFHAAGSGETTWHGLASATFDVAARHGAARPGLDAIATADWPTPARRPADSRLDCSRLAEVFGITMPDWQDSLVRVVTDIIAQESVIHSAG
jgi:dTDP-4-dehydrorhamnose reductase